MKTLFVSDLDGTLLQNNSKISEKSCQIINRLMNRGIFFSYATARGLATARKVTEGLHCTMPVITKNGVIIVRPDTGEIVSKNLFRKGEAEDIYHILCDGKIDPIVFSYQDGKERFSYNRDTKSEGIQWFVSEHRQDERDHPLTGYDKILAGEIFYFACIGTRELLEETYQKIRDRYQCIFSKDTYNDRMWLEIMPKSATKASAVLQLKEMMEFDYIIAFGDGVNDIPMFEIADECYAVKNGDACLKELATGIIETNQSDGVANWLENFAEGYLA